MVVAVSKHDTTNRGLGNFQKWTVLDPGLNKIALTSVSPFLAFLEEDETEPRVSCVKNIAPYMARYRHLHAITQTSTSYRVEKSRVSNAYSAQPSKLS